MKYSQRYQKLNTQFRLGNDMHLNESDLDIRHFSFRSCHEKVQTAASAIDSTDETIVENYSFVYPVFMPAGITKAGKAILLIHGLNERNWNKYLTWAEYLCSETGNPVILFPIAFHMNRSPASWSNPRVLQPIMSLRRQQNGEERSLSFANVALSYRISERPYRFYSSGRQSIHDLSVLFGQIKSGNHELFHQNTQIDIFAYSIGAFLAEITMLTNPDNLFSDSKLCMFCGGGIFSSMIGESRSIMDKTAFRILYDYYLLHFTHSAETNSLKDSIYHSFNSMIAVNRNQAAREHFFSSLGNRLKGITLIKDKVMPAYGIAEAVGASCAERYYSQLDFPFSYTHENPFPVGSYVDPDAVDAAFCRVFSEISRFFKDSEYL